MATNSGGWLYEANGTPVDKATADNAQARVLEIKADASAAKSDAASALSTANSYAGQIAQANTTAGSALTTAQDAKDTVERLDTDVTLLKERDQLAPGQVVDQETALVLNDPNSQSYAVQKAQIGESSPVKAMPAAPAAPTDGEQVTIGRHAYSPSGLGTTYVQNGATNRENVIGGLVANVTTNTSNVPADGAGTGAGALTAPNGNWSAILHGYDNVNNGWASVITGFHNIAEHGADHVTIAGGYTHRALGTCSGGTISGGQKHTVDGTSPVIAGGEENTATATHGVVGGGYRNKATGLQSTVGGGASNETTGVAATVSGGATNKATANYATVAGGTGNVASGASSFVAGGNNGQATVAHAFIGTGVSQVNNGLYGFIGAGYENTVDGNYGAVLAGRGNKITAGGTYGTALGREAVADFYGAYAQSNGSFTVAGDAQTVAAILRNTTTGTTAADLRLDGSNHRPTPAVNTTWAITGTIVARRTDGGGTQSAAYKVEATFARNTATAVAVGTPTVTPLNGQTPPAGWGLTVGINSANGGLAVTATGADGATIRWVASLEIVQVQS